MGKFNSSTNHIFETLQLNGQVFSSPAWFNGKLYYAAVGDALKAFAFASGSFQNSPASQSSQTFPYPGATPSISANGIDSAIVWVAENSSPAVLHAYDASNLANELYNSNQANGRDNFGDGNKFIVPTVVNGKVYVATTNGVGVFGLLSAPPDFSLSMSPGSQTVAAGGSTSYTVTATASNGFSGAVSFGVSVLPAGASGSFNPPSVAGSGSSTLTVNTTNGTSTGGFTVTVTGTSGSLSHNTSATLNVTGGGAPSPPTAVSVSPNAGSGSAQTFAFVFSDPNGAANIVSTQMDVNATLTAAGACYLYYGRASNSIQLANDGGSFGAALTIGSAGTQQNSQCIVDAGASSVNLSGNTLTVNLALSFKPAFAGAKNVYMEAQNATLDSGWAQRGTWMVP
jgi:hypothetical protein